MFFSLNLERTAEVASRQASTADEGKALGGASSMHLRLLVLNDVDGTWQRELCERGFRGQSWKCRRGRPKAEAAISGRQSRAQASSAVFTHRLGTLGDRMSGDIARDCIAGRVRRADAWLTNR
jgi:hypothetical protein